MCKIITPYLCRERNIKAEAVAVLNLMNKLRIKIVPICGLRGFLLQRCVSKAIINTFCEEISSLR